MVQLGAARTSQRRSGGHAAGDPAGPGSAGGPAEVAWVVGRTGQGRGYAREAATSLVGQLHRAGWTVVAHIHPQHLASERVARAAGLRPTRDLVDGEVRWQLPTPPPA